MCVPLHALMAEIKAARWWGTQQLIKLSFHSWGQRRPFTFTESIRRFQDLSWTCTSDVCVKPLLLCPFHRFIFWTYYLIVRAWTQQASHPFYDTNALCFGNLRRCSLCSGCSSFNSDREVLKGNFAHVWEEAEKAVLVRVLELRGADMWSVTATIVGAERDEGHRGHFLPTILLLNGWIKPHVSFNLSSWAKTKPGNSSEWAERRSPLLACEPSVGDIDAQLIIVVWHHWHKQRECGDSLC